MVVLGEWQHSKAKTYTLCEGSSAIWRKCHSHFSRFRCRIKSVHKKTSYRSHPATKAFFRWKRCARATVVERLVTSSLALLHIVSTRFIRFSLLLTFFCVWKRRISWCNFILSIHFFLLSVSRVIDIAATAAVVVLVFVAAFMCECAHFCIFRRLHHFADDANGIVFGFVYELRV